MSNGLSSVTMDPRHPRIALASIIAGLLVAILSISNMFGGGILDHSGEKFSVSGFISGDNWVENSWSIQEWIALLIVFSMIALNYWAKREHETPVVHQHGTSDEQYAALEDLPTMVNLSESSQDVSPNTAAVIASIVGETQSQTKQVVANAIDALSSGEIGRTSAEVVANNDIDYNPKQSKSMTERNFVTDGVSSVPLPVMPEVADLELPELPDFSEVPAMPDLDDLLSDEKEVLPPLDLPELPEF